MEIPLLAATGPRHTDEFLAYTAGYLDGEGCFMFNRTPVVEVTSVFPYTLYAFAEAYGGHVSHRPRRPGHSTKDYYQWRVYGDDAISLIKCVVSLLREKVPQARVLLQIRETEPGHRREGLKAQLKSLKKLEYKRGTYGPKETGA
jgi:hypothetical protein